MSSVAAYEWLLVQAPTLYVGTELQSRREDQTFSRYRLDKEGLQFSALHLGWDFKITLPEWFFASSGWWQQGLENGRIENPVLKSAFWVTGKRNML